MQDHVYAVVHKTKPIAYIGRTYRTLEERFAEHLADADKGLSHKSLAEALRFERDAFEIIECEHSETASEAAWMQRFHDDGYELLNDRPGDKAPPRLNDGPAPAWKEQPIYVPTSPTGVGLTQLTRTEYEALMALPTVDERWAWLKERRAARRAAR